MMFITISQISLSKFIVISQNHTSTNMVIGDTGFGVDVTGKYNVLASPPSIIPFKNPKISYYFPFR